MEHDDILRAAIIERAEKLEMTAYAIAKATGWKITKDAVSEFLAGNREITSRTLHLILRELGVNSHKPFNWINGKPHK